MTRCLFDELFSMSDYESLVCAAISRGYAMDELREDYLEMSKSANHRAGRIETEITNGLS